MQSWIYTIAISLTSLTGSCFSSFTFLISTLRCWSNNHVANFIIRAIRLYIWNGFTCCHHTFNSGTLLTHNFSYVYGFVLVIFLWNAACKLALLPINYIALSTHAGDPNGIRNKPIMRTIFFSALYSEFNFPA